MGTRYLALLSAYLLSDGGISAKGKNNWTLYFRNKDTTVIEEFLKILNKCEEKKPTITKRSDGTSFVKINSKNLAKEMFLISPSYRTKACKNHPICMHLKNKRSACNSAGTIKINGEEYPRVRIPEILYKNKNLAIKFLRIYCSCDGGVSVTVTKNKNGSKFLVRKVLISVKHPILSSQITKLLENLGYKPSVYPDQIRLVKREDIEKFYKEIKFIEGAKISNNSKLLSAYEKNHILKLMVESYQNPKSLINFLLKIKTSSRLIRD